MDGQTDEGKQAERLRYRFSNPENLASQIAVLTNFESDIGVLERSVERIDEVALGRIKSVRRARKHPLQHLLTQTQYTQHLQ